MDEFEHSLGFLFTDITRYYRKVFDYKMKPLGITRSQWWLMGHLHREEGISQTKLAEILDIGKGSVGGLIDRMEAAGFVERHPDPNDRRSNLIYLTNKATSIIETLFELANQVIEDSMCSLSEENRKVLINMLKTIKGNLLEMNGQI